MSAEFPFIGTTVEMNDTDEELPVFTMWAWDFEQDKFIYDGNGNHKLLYRNPALEVWIYKTLKTERYSYLVYSWQYGIELKPFIGKVMGVQERKSELKRMIVEALMVNPYIKSIDKVTFEDVKHGETLSTVIELTTVYGEMTVDV